MSVVDNPFKLTVGKDGRICVSQEVVVYTREENDRIRAEFERLTSENTKLRELVEDMLDCIDIQIAFEQVPARWMQDEFASRARELEIEVDG